MKTKLPPIAIVFGCVYSKGDIMPPHIFELGLRLNLDGYAELLNTGQALFGEDGCWKTIRVSVKFNSLSHLQEGSEVVVLIFFYDFNLSVWPLNSPDSNLMDY